jgi:hypothetical protein
MGQPLITSSRAGMTPVKLVIVLDGKLYDLEANWASVPQ